MSHTPARDVPVDPHVETDQEEDPEMVEEIDEDEDPEMVEEDFQEGFQEEVPEEAVPVEVVPVEEPEDLRAQRRLLEDHLAFQYAQERLFDRVEDIQPNSGYMTRGEWVKYLEEQGHFRAVKRTRLEPLDHEETKPYNVYNRPHPFWGFQCYCGVWQSPTGVRRCLRTRAKHLAERGRIARYRKAVRPPLAREEEELAFQWMYAEI